MGEDHRVRLRMGQVEGSAQGVAELVVQGHADRAQHHAAQPGAIEGVRPGLAVARIAGNPRQRRSEGANALLRHQRDDRVGVLGVQALHGVGDGVHARRRRQAGGKGQGEVHVIEDHLGQDFRAALGGLQSVPGLAEDRRGLGTGVGGGDDDLRQIGAQGDRLAQARGRSTAQGHGAVRAQVANDVHRPLGDLHRRVHGRLGEQPCAQVAQPVRQVPRGVGLLRRRKDQRPAAAERPHLIGDPGQRARAEHNPARKAGIDEGLHTNLRRLSAASRRHSAHNRRAGPAGLCRNTAWAGLS